MVQLINKAILIVSPESWDHIFVSKHHYAIHLAKKGNKIYFLNPPKSEYCQSESGYENLTILDYPGFWKGLYRMPKYIRKFNVQQVYRRLEALVGLQFDVMWSFDNSVFFDLDFLPESVLKISHIVDLNQDFNTKQASSSADVCFGVIPEIVKRHQRFNSECHLIKHAVNVNDEKKQVTLPGAHDFKILYFGNLAMRHLNWDLMTKAVRMVDADFVFLGSGSASVPERVRDLKNVHLMGKVPTNQLMSYMDSASLLMLFYKPSYFEDCASPHKIMEYLSSGKPILSMNILEYAPQKDFIYMASTDEQWLILLQEIATNYETYSTETIDQRRIQFALENTYSKRIEEIESILSVRK